MPRKLSVKVVHNTSVYRPQEAAAALRAALLAHGMKSWRYRLELVSGRYAATSDGRQLGACGRAVIGGIRKDAYGTRNVTGLWVAMACPDPLADMAEMPMDWWLRWLWTLDHEVLHLKGLDHSEMGWHAKKEAAALGEGTPPEWATDLARLRVEPAKPEPTTEERRAAKLEHAEAMLAKAQTRERRAAAIVARWKRRITALRAADKRMRFAAGGMP